MALQSNTTVAIESEPQQPQAGRRTDIVMPIVTAPGVSSIDRTLKDLLMTPRFIKSFNITTAHDDKDITQLFHGGFVSEYITDSVPDFWKFVYAMQCDVVLRLDMNSCFQHVGLGAIIERPVVALGGGFSYMNEVYQYPHQLIPYGSNKTYQYIVKYPLTFAKGVTKKTTLLQDWCIEVDFVVLERLKLATGVTPNVNFTLYMSFDNIDFAVLHRGDKVT